MHHSLPPSVEFTENYRLPGPRYKRGARRYPCQPLASTSPRFSAPLPRTVAAGLGLFRYPLAAL